MPINISSRPMNKILVVVESPGKIAKLQKFLGEEYLVMASVGHIMDLHPKDLSIDVENGFKPTYYTNPDKQKVVTDLRKAYKKCGTIIIATDRDREGEMIGWCIADALQTKNPDRIVFTEITKDEITKSINNKGKLNQNLINAAKARRILDRLMGWELSPLVSTQMKMRLSAGRVQSVIVRLIVDKENEIRQFFKEDLRSTFRFSGELSKGKVLLKSVLHNKTETKSKKKDDHYTGPQTETKNVDEARELMKSLIKSTFTVANIMTDPSVRQPSPPFTTNSLQQIASQRLGMKPVNTMQTAQHLYEAGFITYMRTDSVNLSKEILEMAKNYILQHFGQEYHRAKVYKAKTSNTQEAHEAIRPTSLDVEEIVINKSKKLGPQEQRLYQLIWRRTLASQMSPAKFEVTTIQTDVSNLPKHWMKSSSEVLIFDGFLKVYGVKLQDEIDIDEDCVNDQDHINDQENKISYDRGDKLIAFTLLGKEEYDKPISRYNYASLIKKLDPDNLNIGRPATYSNIIDTITNRRGYVTVTDIPGVEKEAFKLLYQKKKLTETTEIVVIGKEKERFVPQNGGEIIVDYLVDHFTAFFEYSFTAQMEKLLDDISNGKTDWVKAISDFYKKFHPTILKLKDTKPLIEDKHMRKLGVHPKTGQEITATIKIYGPVVMVPVKDTKKIQYASIKNPLTIETITLDQAVDLLKYPKLLGKIGRKSVYLKLSRYGFYATIGANDKINVPNDISEKDITLEKIEKLLEEHNAYHLAQFTNKTKKYTVTKGRFNEKKQKQMPDYIHLVDKRKKYNIPLPPDTDVSILTLKKVEKIIEDYYSKKRGPKNKKKETDDKTLSDTTTKKITVKKVASTTTKKTVAKKVASITAKKTVAKKVASTTAKKTVAKKAPVKTHKKKVKDLVGK